MLAFEHGATMTMTVEHMSRVATTLRLRGFTREGPFSLNVPTTSDLVLNFVTFRLPDFPIWLSLEDQSEVIKQGECYAEVALRINNDKVFTFNAGYVYTSHSLSYPLSETPGAAPFMGNIREITSSDPAANVEISITQPANAIWKVLAFSCRLVTDANAANRRVHLQLTSGGGTAYEAFALVDQTATQTIDYRFGQYGSMTDELDNSINLVTLPNNIYLKSTATVATLTTNRQATDNFGVGKLLVEEIFEPFP